MSVSAEQLQEIQAKTNTLDPHEEAAFDAGWRPLDQWEGEPEDWVSAKEYNRVGEMMERIKSQGNQLRSYTKKMDQLEVALKTLGEHNAKIAEEEYNKAMADLKSIKVQAMEEGDFETVVEVDERIAEYKTAAPKKAPVQQQEDAPVDPVILDWLETNDWYEKDPVMRGAAEAMMRQINEGTPGIKPAEVLEMVEETMREEFPHKFGGTRGNFYRSTTTETDTDGTTRAKTKKCSKYGARQLNEEQTKIGKVFVRTGAMKSLDEYAAQLTGLQELDAQRGAQ